MILCAKRIAELLELGENPKTEDPFVIIPNPTKLLLSEPGSTSVDLRLGTWFVSLRAARMGSLKIDEHSLQKISKTHYVRFGEAYYLHPGNFVLGTTLEWMRFPHNLSGYVVGKSGWGRRGLVIATATGVHPGFTGCLTLELCNMGEIPIEIEPGMRICQLCIHNVNIEKSIPSQKSMFMGRRRPYVGEIKIDEFARRLIKINKPKDS
jgi:dCTP deaminase